MRKQVLSFSSLVFVLVFLGSFNSCNSDEGNGNAVASDSSVNSETYRDTAMPHESVQTAAASTDSLTPNAQNSTKDSIGSKISIHLGKVKVIDTTKNDE